MKDGLINDVTGLDFSWWIIWKKRINKKHLRARRDLDEGSGEEFDEDDEDYYDE